jgi:hypothetical protein
MVPKLDACSSGPITIGRDIVYKTDNLGLLFVVSKGFKGKPRRLYGTIGSCERCKMDFFRADRDRKRGRSIYCSNRCSKLGDLNPTRVRKQENPKQTADREFGKLVRSVGRCERCGRTDSLECAHGFSRRYLQTRCDRRNAFCLCHFCHRHYTVRPLEWDLWLKDRWGEALYDEMRAKALSHGHPDWEDITRKIRHELNNLTS